MEFIEFMRSRVENTESFNELIDSHAYRFRNPDVTIEKFFINYGEFGGEGKTLLNSALAKVYTNMANVGVTQEQIERDQFNAWMARCLFIGIEEAEQGKTNYVDKTMHQRIKQLTSANGSIRGMYKESVAAKMNLIIHMNTNVRDLYGLVRGDNALIERLVILSFKKVENRNELHERARYFMTHPDFAHSLYHYLAFTHEISEKFTPVRYYGQDKFDFIKRAQVCHKNMVEDWIVENSDEFTEKKFRGHDNSHKFMFQNTANESYRNYFRQQNSPVGPKKINQTMTDLGFEMIKITINGQCATIWRIPTSDFDELISKLSGQNELPYEEIDDEVDGNSF